MKWVCEANRPQISAQEKRPRTNLKASRNSGGAFRPRVRYGRRVVSASAAAGDVVRACTVRTSSAIRGV